VYIQMFPDVMNLHLSKILAVFLADKERVKSYTRGLPHIAATEGTVCKRNGLINA